MTRWKWWYLNPSSNLVRTSMLGGHISWICSSIWISIYIHIYIYIYMYPYDISIYFLHILGRSSVETHGVSLQIPPGRNFHVLHAPGPASLARRCSWNSGKPNPDIYWHIIYRVYIYIYGYSIIYMYIYYKYNNIYTDVHTMCNLYH